ncbi:MAG: hypothetical protein ACTS8S_05660 [Giesbergeria sp.]
MNGEILVCPARRRYFGSTPSAALSHVFTVYRANPVLRAISDSVKSSRKYNRLNLPNFCMVIIPFVPAKKLGRIG